MAKPTVDQSTLTFLRKMARQQRINAASLPTLLTLIDTAERFKPLKKRLRATEEEFTRATEECTVLRADLMRAVEALELPFQAEVPRDRIAIELRKKWLEENGDG